MLPVIIGCVGGGDVEKMSKVMAKLTEGERNVFTIMRSAQHSPIGRRDNYK